MSGASDEFLTVAKVGEIPAGGVKVVRLGDRPVALFHLDDGWYALDDICTHDGGELASGTVDGGVIECPRHGARFDIRTGAVQSLPAVAPVPTYEVRIVGDQVQVRWGETADAAGGGSSRATTAGAGSPAPTRAAADTGRAPAGAGATSAPSQQEIAIRSALETVIDPEINLSVIDLGLIREIEVQPGRTRVRMLLTTPFCPYAPQMIEDVKQAAQSVVMQETEVEILPDPWSPDMMPDPGLLGFSY